MKKIILLLLVLIILLNFASAAIVEKEDLHLKQAIQVDEEAKFLLAKENIISNNIRDQLKTDKIFIDQDENKEITTISYSQEYNGLKVYNSYLTVNSVNDKIVAVRDNYYDVNMDINPSISLEKAIEIVGLKNSVSSELIIYPYQKENYLVWKIDYPLIKAPLGEWTYFVNAKSGEIINVENNLIDVHGNVTGMIYEVNPSDPQIEKNFTLNYLDVSNGTHSYQTSTLDGFYNVTNITGNVTIRSNFSSPYVWVTNDQEAETEYEYNTTDNETHSWNWNSTDESDRDEESNVYYHVNFAHEFFTNGGYFNITEMDFQMRAIVNYDAVDCNAFYSMSTERLTFIKKNQPTCDNPALFSDIIYHEYTHGVTDKIYTEMPYQGMTGAMHEAFSDYFAASITDDSEIAEDWQSSPLRDISQNYVYPTNYAVGGSLHSNSRILSGALWDLRTLMGVNQTDEFVIRAMRMQAHSYAEVLEDLLIINDDNLNLSDGTPNSTQICGAFEAHGIYSYYCNQTFHSYDITNISLQWIDVKTNGQIISSSESRSGIQGMGDDDVAKEIMLGFDFPFHGLNYDSVFINSNGFLTLKNHTMSLFEYDCVMPTVEQPTTVISVLCADLDPSPAGNGAVYYLQTADNFTIEWNNISLYGTSDYNTFQATLYSNGTIIFRYNSLTGNPYPEVGIENELGTKADLYHNSKSISSPLALRLEPTNNAPTITNSNPGTQIIIFEPNNQSLNLTYTDNENDAVGIDWYINGYIVAQNQTNYTIEGNYTTAGIYNVTAILSDFQKTSFVYWNLTINNTDTTPIIDSVYPSIINLTMYENSSQIFNHTSNDIDGDVLGYAWFLNGTEIGNEWNLSFNPGFDSEGFFNLTFIVNDTQGNPDSRYWNLTVLNLNRVPVWDVLNQSINQGENLSVELNATDPDGSNISFYVNNTNFNISNGNLTWDPDSFTGNKTIILYASDDETNSTLELRIEVVPNQAPSFNGTIANQSWYKGLNKTNAFDLDNYFSDNENDTLIYGFTGNSNITINISANNSVNFSANASWTGSEIVRFYANDTYGQTYSNNITLTISTPPVENNDENNNNNNGGSGGGGSGGGAGAASSSSSAGGSASMTWSTISAGQGKAMKINKDELPLSRIEFKAVNELKTFNLKVEKLSEKPSTTKNIEKKVYSYIKIEKSQEEELEQVVISFQVKKEWLKNESLNKEEVVLYRYVNDWIELETWIVDENSTIIFYNATTPGFSYFAIGERELAAQIISADILAENVLLENVSDSNQSSNLLNVNNGLPETTNLIGNNSQENIIEGNTSKSFGISAGTILILVLAGVFFYNSKSKNLPMHKLEKHGAHINHGDLVKLKSAANNLRAEGYSKKKIVSVFKKVGWSDKDIKEVFKK